jgi:ABC-type transport system involved in multi-copper enzyme maturation permease subunit
MTGALENAVSMLPSLLWLTGPIFDKELRVSSRRKRNYVLRSAYIALLTVFVAVAWWNTVNAGGGSPAYQASRMAEAGKYVITTILWFQFVTIPLIAVVMLSTAINSEIHQRTLGVLMTTPISSVQVVVGKLLSKLLQLILLLGISLPILSIVRVFGGVPWDYVISGLCITLTAAVFAGSISLLLSIYTRHAHSVIVRTILICFLLYVAPLGVFALLRTLYGVVGVDAVFPYINPFVAMSIHTGQMLVPSSVGSGMIWPVHCAIMLGGSAFLLAVSTVSVRRVGLRQAAGQTGAFSSWRERRAGKRNRQTRAVSPVTAGKIRRVKGPPIIWKEMTTAFIKRRTLSNIIGAVAAGLILVAAYGICAYEGVLGDKSTHIGFVVMYVCVGLFRTSTFAATSVTSEREAQTLAMLLATPLERRQIVLGKIFSSCLQSRAVWLLLGAHIVLFALTRCIHPAAIVPLAVLTASSALMVAAVGVAISSSCRRSATAAAINMIVFLWMTVPLCVPLPTAFFSPLFLTGVILNIAGGSDVAPIPFYRLDYPFSSGAGGLFISVVALLGIVTIYLFAAGVCIAIANTNLRRKIF